uniref:U24-ctenitoxin-Pn1a n=1 Tax=Parasteatoda tepidariorum TaxID=114398 RepID=A0A2L2Z6Z6_PARTP
MLKIVGILALCLFATTIAADEEKEPTACELNLARRLTATLTESNLHLITERKENGN